MSNTGTYLYGFTDSQFHPEGPLLGLANQPVRTVGYRDVAAVISNHPLQRLAPRRANLEPHHRVVRQISSHNPLVPAAFGHISESEEEIRRVLEDNYGEIREEVRRLANKSEMKVKLSWNAENIFLYFVQHHDDLRELRDRVFRNPNPAFDDKLKVGSLFDSLLNGERERLSAKLLGALKEITVDAINNPAREERTVSDLIILIESTAHQRFAQLLQRAALLYDTNFTLQYSGPWPPYSFVRLQLQTSSALT